MERIEDYYYVPSNSKTIIDSYDYNSMINKQTKKVDGLSRMIDRDIYSSMRNLSDSLSGRSAFSVTPELILNKNFNGNRTGNYNENYRRKRHPESLPKEIYRNNYDTIPEDKKINYRVKSPIEMHPYKENYRQRSEQLTNTLNSNQLNNRTINYDSNEYHERRSPQIRNYNQNQNLRYNSNLNNYQNYHENNYRNSVEEPKRNYDSKRNYYSNSVDFCQHGFKYYNPNKEDYDGSRYGDYTYNYYLNAPMRSDKSEDWKYPPLYYYKPTPSNINRKKVMADNYVI